MTCAPRRVVGAGLWLLAAEAAAETCERPPLPVIPAQPVAGAATDVAQTTRRYLKGIREHVRCTQADLEAAGGDAAAEQLRATLATRRRGALVEAAAVVSSFNERFAGPDALQLDDVLPLESQPCLSTSSIRDTAVLFRVADGTTYLNPFRTTCGRLDTAFVVTFSLRETPRRICSGESWESGGRGSGTGTRRRGLQGRAVLRARRGR